MSRFTSLLGLVLALRGFDVTGRLVNVFGLPNEGMWPHVWKWVPALSLLGFVRFVEDRSLSSIGLRSHSPRRFVVRTVVSLVVFLGANAIIEPLTDHIGEGNEGLEEGLGSFAAFSIPERLFVAFTAGVTEEIMFRGYAMERLEELTGSSVIAGTISTAAFSFGHLSETWDRSAVLRITAPWMILTVLYSRVRDLFASIAAHALNDAIGLLLADRYADED